MVLLEAQALGCPVVAGAYGGVASVVRDGETGLLTPPGDVAAFADAVLTLLRGSRTRRRSLGPCGAPFRRAGSGSRAGRLAGLRNALDAAHRLSRGSMSLRVLIAVTHLLGAGHLTRAAALARAFARAGHATTLVSGGMPARLVASDGVDLRAAAARADRRHRLQDAARRGRRAGRRGASRRAPDACCSTRSEAARGPILSITELFPFGRRVLADEFMALLDEAARARARARSIAVLDPRHPRRADESGAGRGDARARSARLRRGPRPWRSGARAARGSWPVDERIRPLIRYTGYVDENGGPVPAARPQRASWCPADRAPRACRSTARLSRRRAADPGPALAHPRGRGVAEEDFHALRAVAPAHATVERARPDFRTLLAGPKSRSARPATTRSSTSCAPAPGRFSCPSRRGTRPSSACAPSAFRRWASPTIVPEADLSPEPLRRRSGAGLAHAPAPLHPVSRSTGPGKALPLPRACVLSSPVCIRAIDWSPAGSGPGPAPGTGLPRRLLVAGRRCGCRYAPARPPPRPRPPLRGRASALAVIPGGLEPRLPRVLQRRNRLLRPRPWLEPRQPCSPRQKKAEFGRHRPVELMARKRSRPAGRREQLGAKLLPVFVPPWNRIAPELDAAPAALGLSRPLHLQRIAEPRTARRACSRSTPMWTPSTGTAREAWPIRAGSSPAWPVPSSGGSGGQTGTSPSGS